MLLTVKHAMENTCLIEAILGAKTGVITDGARL
jgi:hypothetical protein